MEERERAGHARGRERQQDFEGHNGGARALVFFCKSMITMNMAAEKIKGGWR